LKRAIGVVVYRYVNRTYVVAAVVGAKVVEGSLAGGTIVCG